jgi:hypothetical protein
MSASVTALDRYNTPSPKVSLRSQVDSPLLPHEGIPVYEDNFVDSTDRVINATNSNDVRFDTTNNFGRNIWSVDQSKFYDNSGLGGIDVIPGGTKHFDLGKFNKEFERTKEIAQESQRLRDLNKLNALSQVQEKISLYNLSILQIIINAKDAWFNLLDDLLDQKFVLDTFIKENRLFYVGLTILFFVTVLYLYATVMADDTEQPNENVKIVYHMHNYKQRDTGGHGLSEISDFSAKPSIPILTKTQDPILTKT